MARSRKATDWRNMSLSPSSFESAIHCAPPDQITRFNQDLTKVICPQDDALMVVGDLANFNVKRVLVDTGNVADILTLGAFLVLKRLLKELIPINMHLQGLS
ncbi:Uncharacterized protein Adt_31891 [Abeliophyllum distichum]|uniref:Uncharacterized protein n=1 Tax=Abeliophyllum distichum TaxID=126358 RepID=A0ABD1RFE2_9LAMI